MDSLSTKETKVFNNLSVVRDPSVFLGRKLQEVIDCLAIAGTPVNAVEAKLNLALTGVVIDGETVTINNPLRSGIDVYEFLADDAQTKTTATNIAIDITSRTGKASQSLTVDTQPTSGDTMTIGTKVYIFVPVGTANANGEVSIGADLAEAKLNIVAAINGTDEISTPHPLVTASDFTGDVCTITALIGGTAGNSIATTETFTAGTNVFGDTTLKTGTNCSTANGAADLITAITANDTQGVGAAAGEGTIVALTADVAGAAGNNIAVSETMANAAFAGDAVALAGGVDGTVGIVERAMIDASYLYICVADNTKADKNWRRISLGAAF